MSSLVAARTNRLALFFFLILCVWLGGLVFWANQSLAVLEAKSERSLPFGVVSLPQRGLYAQDFSYQMIFFRGIRDHLVSRPYTLEGQKNLMHQELPEGTSGMTHAYSPVAFVLALPLISVPGSYSYLIYTVLNASGILLLFYFTLLPRVTTLLQLRAFGVVAMSLCLVASFKVGQSALLTTTLLGWLWALLRVGSLRRSVTTDALLAILFWALCLKPNVTIVPFALLLGAKAWRPLGIGFLLLGLTWLCVSSFYGGWWTGLSDYSFLLNHYNNADMGAFMQRGLENAAEMRGTRQSFSLDRTLLLLSTLGLLLLRWSRRISASEHFLGMIWSFLLLSPYLLPSEDWVLCLLVVEGSFFHSKNLFAALAKLLLLAGILDLRMGLTFPLDVNFPLKCILAGWMVCDAMLQREHRTDDVSTAFA